MSERAYKDLVLEDFDRKLAAQKLRPELVSRSRRSLKAHCLNICTERFQQKDELLLQSLFGKKENQAAYVIAIKNANADIFRALHTFLNDRTVNTTFNNISLLAWMIDFEPRPYYPGMKLSAGSVVSPTRTLLQEDKSGSPVTKNKMGSRNKAVLVLSIVSVVLLSIYLIFQYKTSATTGNERCMIWNNDHYQPIDCNSKLVNTAVYPIDHQLISSFKKITRPDTLTLHSVKKVWYINAKGRMEFYTASGFYPLDTNRRLLPMTDYILKKYVYHLTR